MFDFIDGASGDESLRDLNSAMIDHIRLMPRVLIDVSERAMSTSILGQETGFPFGIAPMGMCALAWPRADFSLAREAAKRRERGQGHGQGGRRFCKRDCRRGGL